MGPTSTWHHMRQLWDNDSYFFRVNSFRYFPKLRQIHHNFFPRLLLAWDRDKDTSAQICLISRKQSLPLRCISFFLFSFDYKLSFNCKK